MNRSFNRNHDRIIYMDVRSAELTKYAALQAEGWNYLSVGRSSTLNQPLAHAP